MPTRHKPQLNHKSVRFSEIFECLHHELLAKEKLILELVGFFKEFDGDLSNPAGADLIAEIAGLLATSATIRLDAGYKAPGKVIATLEAIKKDPALALCERTEPEARGALAAAYQRDREPPGTYGFDIYGESGVEPDENQIRIAAEQAIATLRAEATRGRPIAHDVHFLAPRLRAIFLRFNDTIARKSVVSSRGHGDLFQCEDSAFAGFVDETLEALRKFYVSLPNNGDVLVPELSSEYIARLAVGTGGEAPIQIYKFGRVGRGKLSIKEIQRDAEGLQNSGIRLLRSASFWQVMETQRASRRGSR